MFLDSDMLCVNGPFIEDLLINPKTAVKLPAGCLVDGRNNKKLGFPNGKVVS